MPERTLSTNSAPLSSRSAQAPKALSSSRSRSASHTCRPPTRLGQSFPGIVFRAGPTGGRAGIAGGPDVWEIVRDLKGVIAEGTSGDPIETLASVSGLDRGVVELAASYYAACPGTRARSQPATQRIAPGWLACTCASARSVSRVTSKPAG